MESSKSASSDSELNNEMLTTTTGFGVARLQYAKTDLRPTKFDAARKKKIKMSDSFLAAKASYQQSKANPLISGGIVPTEMRNEAEILEPRTDVVVYPEPEDEGVVSNSYILKHAATLSNFDSQTGNSSIYSDDEDKMDGSGKFICSFEGCNTRFESRKELRRHKLSHRVRKHVCPLESCGRAFFEKSKLKRHMVVHTRKKEFNCHICGKKFGYKANVKTHMRTHTGERPFMCRIDDCGKTFAQASNRNAHEKTHFKCPEEKKSRGRGKRKIKKEEISSPTKRKASLISGAEVSTDTTNSVESEGSVEKTTADLAGFHVQSSDHLPVRRSGRIRSREMCRSLTDPIPNLDLDHVLGEFPTNLFGTNTTADIDHVVDEIYRDDHLNHQTAANVFSPQNLNFGTGGIFSSFNSFGNSSFNENDLNHMFKNEFGFHLDAIGEGDVFDNLVASSNEGLEEDNTRNAGFTSSNTV